MTAASRPGRRLLAAGGLLASGLLAACAEPRVVSDIEIHHRLGEPAGRSIAVVAAFDRPVLTVAEAKALENGDAAAKTATGAAENKQSDTKDFGTTTSGSGDWIDPDEATDGDNAAAAVPDENPGRPAAGPTDPNPSSRADGGSAGGATDRSTSLALARYGKALELRLRRAGFRIAGDPSGADLVARLTVGVDGGETVTRTWEEPVFGPPYFHFVPHYHFHRRHGYYVALPWRPYYGTRTRTATQTVYTRRLSLVIAEPDAGETDAGEMGAGEMGAGDGDRTPLYEGQALSRGGCGLLGAVVDEMIEALFYKFPGPPDVTGKIAVPSDGGCGG